MIALLAMAEQDTGATPAEGKKSLKWLLTEEGIYNFMMNWLKELKPEFIQVMVRPLISEKLEGKPEDF